MCIRDSLERARARDATRRDEGASGMTAKKRAEERARRGETKRCGNAACGSEVGRSIGAIADDGTDDDW